MIEEISFELTTLPPLSNAYLNMHFRKRDKVKQSFLWLIREQVKALPLSCPWANAQLSFIRYSPRVPDFDNMVGSYKVLMDCFTLPIGRKKYGLGILVDDTYNNTGQWDCHWIKTPKKDQKIYVSIKRSI